MSAYMCVYARVTLRNPRLCEPSRGFGLAYGRFAVQDAALRTLIVSYSCPVLHCCATLSY
eukprot:1379908-Prymnesium_polylepis.1